MSVTDSLFYIHTSLISSIPSEKQLESYHQVTLEDNNIKLIDLHMRVTTHRLLFTAQNNKDAFLIEGDKITEAVISESGMLWGKEYFVKIRTNMGKVKIQLKNYKEAHVTISGMVRNREWTKSYQKEGEVQKGSGMYSGLFSKLEKEKQKIDANTHKVSQSFVNFQTLFGNLREIKELMKDMKSSTGQSDGENSEIHDILKDIGFVQSISKDEAGGKYYQQLAQDLYHICQNVLFKKYGGIVPLLDLFYFYNMKRQMSLVSPEELLKACEKFKHYGFKARLNTYPGNIRVVESTSFSAEEDFQVNFREYFEDWRQGWSAEEIARRKGVPLAIIDIKLRKATRRGVLALDSRIEGQKYYRNIIMEKA